jgi:hypothetical protein
MNKNQTVRRIITELSACEKQIDAVLFARNQYDDDDDGSGLLTAGIGGTALAGGATAGAYYRGRNKLASEAAEGGMLPGFEKKGPGIAGTIGKGFKTLGQDVKGLPGNTKSLYKNLLERAKAGAKAFRA